jgi:hypothetical protein
MTNTLGLRCPWHSVPALMRLAGGKTVSWNHEAIA